MALQLVLYFIRVRCVRLPAPLLRLLEPDGGPRSNDVICSVSACWGVGGMCCVVCVLLLLLGVLIVAAATSPGRSRG